jgi:hypothetical protein
MASWRRNIPTPKSPVLVLFLMPIQAATQNLMVLFFCDSILTARNYNGFEIS